MFIEEVVSRQRGKTYRTVLVRETYRVKGKVKHRTLSNITCLPPPVIAQIKRSLKTASSRHSVQESDDFVLGTAREYGASFAFRELARQIGLDQAIYSRKTDWREHIMAMIIGRVVYQGSKLALTQRYADSCLWEVAGHATGIHPDVDKACYEPLDQLLAAQERIQKNLAKKHLSDGCLVLYDLTNLWLEGEYKTSQLAGYGRDKSGKRGYQQIAIGLITNKSGCPVATEVFRGGTSEQTPLKQQVERVARRYGLQHVVLAGDRGLLTPCRIEEVSEAGFHTLTALTHPQRAQLMEKRIVNAELFDEKNIAEALDGAYVIRSDVSAEQMTAQECVDNYKRLQRVEKAFRNLKTVCLELRPVYHKTDERIRAHVFLCMLAYYLLWHAEGRLQPLFEKDAGGKNRRWTLALVIDRLKSITKVPFLKMGHLAFGKITQPDEEQQHVLNLLMIKLE